MNNDAATSDRPIDHTPGGAILLDGNRLRDETVLDLARIIAAAGSPPVCLATVLVGADKPSQIYVRMKQRKAEEAGMISRHVELPSDATQQQVLHGGLHDFAARWENPEGAQGF